MKIDKDTDSLLLIPETEFEEQALTEMFHLGKTYGAYIKTGMTMADVIGLKISTRATSGSIEIVND